jgi:hypothetical protein
MTQQDADATLRRVPDVNGTPQRARRQSVRFSPWLSARTVERYRYSRMHWYT